MVRHRWWVLLVAVALDWLSKWFSWRSFDVSANTGVSFGLGNQYLVGVGLLVVALIGYRHKYLWNLSGWWMMLGGVAANLGERLWWGRVSDWIDLLGVRFNMADVFIVFGCMAILWQERTIKR